VDCLKRKGIISEENIDEINCELYFETNFIAYKSHEEFIIETSLPILEDEINNIFISPKTTPSFLIEALIDDFFTIGFGEHIFQDYISRNYMQIKTENGYYVIYVDNLNYDLSGILDYVDVYIDNYEHVKSELMNLLKKYYETN
jgi:hypothetical protein